MSATASGWVGGRRHWPQLDGLRGLAVLLVIVYHAFDWLDPTHGVDRLLTPITKLGWTGVDLFFVLSGFLITGILLDEKGRPGMLRRFYVRRALRIFPLYYAFLAAVFWLLPALGVDRAVVGQRTDDQWYWWAYLGNVYLAMQGTFTTGHANLQHFWSLAVEEQFYVIWPFVVLLTSARTLQRICLASLLLSPLLRLMVWQVAPSPELIVYTLPVTHMDGLAVGGLLATVLREPGLLERLRWPIAATAAVSALAFGALVDHRASTDHNDPWIQVAGFSLVALSFGGLLTAAIVWPRGPLASAASMPVMRFFGRYSYAMYVFHPLVSLASARWIFPDVGAGARPLPQAGLLAAHAAVVLAITILLSIVSWHLLEKHFLALKQRFDDTTPIVSSKAMQAHASAAAAQ